MFEIDELGEHIGKFAGMLRCNTCGDTELLHNGDHGRYLKSGWPTCHGHTMQWWTQAQIDAGEMPNVP